MAFARWRVGDSAGRARVERALREIDGYQERQEANCSLRLDFQRGAERVIVRQFTNGTLTLQDATGARQSGLFAELRARIDSTIGGPAQNGTTTPRGSDGTATPRAAGGAERTRRVHASEGNGLDPATVFTGAWIGTDEAGKGDYFGPLVSAAVFVDERTAALLKELGVRDSKTLSDAQVRRLAGVVRQTVGSAGSTVVRLQPERYNTLYEEFRREGKSLNALLAWAHARAIEDLLAGGVATTNVLVDRFTDVEYIRARLLRSTQARSINLVALPRAEANVAVAAASILARTAFLDWLERTSRELGLGVPKGASVAVITAAREIVQRYGTAKLRELAKLHFKTTESVLHSKA